MSNRLKGVDRLVWPFAGLFARSLSAVSNRVDRSRQALIVRPGGMGDLIMAQIAAEELGLDLGKLDWVIEARSESWARSAGLNYFCYDRHPARVLQKLRGRYSVVINTEQYFGLSQVFAAACVAPRGRTWGFDTNRARLLASATVPYNWDDSPEVIEFHRLIGTALFGSPPAKPAPRHRRFASDGRSVIGLAGLEAPSRHLTVEKQLELIRPWLGTQSAVICCAPRDRGVASTLAERLGAGSTVFGGDFGGMRDLISRSERLFCMDGGMVHIASYFGVPVTAIFTSGRSGKWGPLAPGSAIIKRTGLYCQPCTLFGQTPPCRNNYACKEIDFFQHHTKLP